MSNGDLHLAFHETAVDDEDDESSGQSVCMCVCVCKVRSIELS